MSEKIPACILVRTSSSRLPKKCFLPFGTGCVIEHVMNRANHFNFEPIICTTDDSSDNELFDLVKNRGCKAFRGSTNDKIKRLRDAADFYRIDKFITIDADDPFFDPEIDNKSFQLLKQGYDFVLPPQNYYCGSVGYSVRKYVLDRAINEYDTSDSEMMWKIIEKLEGIKLKEIEVENTNISDIRLTLDYEEDYHLLLAVLRILGPLAESHQIKELFNRNPDLHKINWFRQTQWKENQEKVKY